MPMRTWLTWCLTLLCGATVVSMDEEVVRRGPDLLPWLRDERISVLCPPPTLLPEDPAAVWMRRVAACPAAAQQTSGCIGRQY